MHKSPLIVSGIIFLIAALVHLKRIITPFAVQIGDFALPEWFSYFGFALFLVMALWNFIVARRVCCSHKG